jgi:hypothetical protein
MQALLLSMDSVCQIAIPLHTTAIVPTTAKTVHQHVSHVTLVVTACHVQLVNSY